MKAPTVKVRFVQVGRDKETWDAELPLDGDNVPSDRAALASIRKQGALRSADVEIDWTDWPSEASVIVGGFRKVGTIVRLDAEGGAL